MRSILNFFQLSLAMVAFIPATALANDLVTTNSSAAAMADTRYGWFNALDHRSWHNEGDFPEPFLVDDTGLEINKARFDLLHTGAGGQHNDLAAAEVEKGFGLATVELRVPYERDVASDQTSQGFGNIEVGARHPFYQYVSPSGFFDTTMGAALEVGIPVNSQVSKNPELVPKVFNDLRVGEHFTLQSLFGYSVLYGGGSDGGLRTFANVTLAALELQRARVGYPTIMRQCSGKIAKSGRNVVRHDKKHQKLLKHG